jgi:hypothetical protein
MFSILWLLASNPQPPTPDTDTVVSSRSWAGCVVQVSKSDRKSMHAVLQGIMQSGNEHGQ